MQIFLLLIVDYFGYSSNLTSLNNKYHHHHHHLPPFHFPIIYPNIIHYHSIIFINIIIIIMVVMVVRIGNHHWCCCYCYYYCCFCCICAVSFSAGEIIFRLIASSHSTNEGRRRSQTVKGNRLASSTITKHWWASSLFTKFNASSIAQAYAYSLTFQLFHVIINF